MYILLYGTNFQRKILTNWHRQKEKFDKYNIDKTMATIATAIVEIFSYLV